PEIRDGVLLVCRGSALLAQHRPAGPVLGLVDVARGVPLGEHLLTGDAADLAVAAAPAEDNQERDAAMTTSQRIGKIQNGNGGPPAQRCTSSPACSSRGWAVADRFRSADMGSSSSRFLRTPPRSRSRAPETSADQRHSRYARRRSRSPRTAATRYIRRRMRIL